MRSVSTADLLRAAWSRHAAKHAARVADVPVRAAKGWLRIGTRIRLAIGRAILWFTEPVIAECFTPPPEADLDPERVKAVYAQWLGGRAPQ